MRKADETDNWVTSILEVAPINTRTMNRRTITLQLKGVYLKILIFFNNFLFSVFPTRVGG